MGSGSTLNVILQSTDNRLNEVVVVAYGTQKKVNLSGSVNTVDTKTIVNRPTTSLTNALQGTVPGLTIKSAPGDLGRDLGTINVRGRSNLGTSEPLFVVDGVIVSSGDFARVNPNDVAGISVLKDASASSIYGARAANGVILVTTKRGGGGEFRINYSGYYGSQKATYLPDFTNGYDYALMRNEAETNAGRQPLYKDADLTAIRTQSNPDLFPDNDWYKLTLKNSAPMMEHQLSISGGDKTQYYLSGAYYLQGSLIPGKDLKRYSMRSNTLTQVTEKLRVGSNLSYIRDGFNNDNGEIDFTSLSRLTPLIVARQSDGQWGSVNGGREDASLITGNTLRRLAEGGRQNYVTNRFLGTLTGTYTPIKGLDIGGLFSYNYLNYQRSIFTKTMAPIVGFISGNVLSSTAVNTNQLQENWQNTQNLLAQATASYEKTLDKHYFKVLAGASYEKSDDRTIELIRKGFPNNDLNAISAGSTAPANTTAIGNLLQSALASVFGRANYSYNDRYLAEISVRNDASSRFAPGHRSAWYPSGSVAWRISQEEFLKSSNVINELKVRVSAGKLGNINNVGNYDFFDGLASGTASILDQTKTDGVWPAKLANTALSWEKLTTYNAGLDATMFKSLNVQLDVFRRVTKDILLANPDIPDEAGLVSSDDLNVNEVPSINMGTVRNDGIELSLSYTGKIGKLGYSLGGNLSKIWNKITYLGDGVSATAPSTYYRNIVGQPIGSFYMLQANGLFKSDAEAAAYAFQSSNTKGGDIKYVDQNGDNIINGDDRTVVGNDVPYFTYGVNISANYKGFDLNVIGQGVNDVKVYLEAEAAQAFFNGSGVKNYALGRWTAQNPDPNAVYPRMLLSGDNTQNINQFNSFWLFDADYFRIKAISLGYTIPPAVLAKAGIKGLRVYLSSNNPFTIRADKRLGDFDPEVPSQRSAYPAIKTLSFGLNLTL